MLKENIKTLRKSKGLSQEELAIKLNVVRQTISKWEQGLSVPDAEMLIKLAEVLDTTVSILLGEKISESKVDDLKAISEKLEVINLQLSQRKSERRKIIYWLLISLCVIMVGIFIVLILLKLRLILTRLALSVKSRQVRQFFSRFNVLTVEGIGGNSLKSRYDKSRDAMFEL